jgi:hypothetical protein
MFLLLTTASTRAICGSRRRRRWLRDHLHLRRSPQPLGKLLRFFLLALVTQKLNDVVLLIFELSLKTGLVLVVKGLRVSFGRRLDLRNDLVFDDLRSTDAALLSFSIEQQRIDLQIEFPFAGLDNFTLQIFHAFARFRAQILFRDLHSIDDADNFRQRLVFATAVDGLGSRLRTYGKHKKNDK